MSLYGSNFFQIKYFLQEFQQTIVEKQTNAMVISETWLSDNKELQDGLEGYEMCKTRLTKRGEVLSSMWCLILNARLLVIWQPLLTSWWNVSPLKLIAKDQTNVLISCIYRTPGSCIDQFNKKLSELYDKHIDWWWLWWL